MSFSLLEKEEFLLGILLMRITAEFGRNFLVLFFYKSLGFTKHDTLAIFILSLILIIAFYVYLQVISNRVSDKIKSTE